MLNYKLHIAKIQSSTSKRVLRSYIMHGVTDVKSGYWPLMTVVAFHQYTKLKNPRISLLTTYYKDAVLHLLFRSILPIQLVNEVLQLAEYPVVSCNTASVREGLTIPSNIRIEQ